jgi:hypothetical protein
MKFEVSSHQIVYYCDVILRNDNPTDSCHLTTQYHIQIFHSVGLDGTLKMVLVIFSIFRSNCSSINISDDVKTKPLLFAAVPTDLTYPTLKRKNGRGNRTTAATKLVVSIINIQEDKQTSRQ